MAKAEHVRVFERGPEEWNRWRLEYPNVRPDLSNAGIPNVYFVGRASAPINLSLTNLSNSTLEGAILRRCDFDGADLSGATLNFSLIDMSSFRNANLAHANLVKASITLTSLQDAILKDADLSNALLGNCKLERADLRSAFLQNTDLSWSNLTGANLHDAQMGFTTFGNNDLSGTLGLDSINHVSPSIVGVDTIYRSRGMIPEAFLRGCGLAESFIVQIPALIAGAQPIQFYSCFISYSFMDQEFADRLHADLQAKGVRVWFATHDLPIGARLRPTIDESIRVYDKLLLILSEKSVASQWVEQEVETALAREREQNGRLVLFPIRIDDTVMKSNAGWPALLKNTRNIGDFRRWKSHDAYTEAFDRLLRDLRTEP